MAAQPKHRQAIIQAAATLFRRRGYAATGLNDIVARSRAPKGSLYHYFPQGKAQIGEAAVRYAGGLVERTLEQIAAEAPDAASLVRDYVQRLASWMEQSSWRDGCPISTVLLETAGEDESLRQAGLDAFGAWESVIAGRLRADGVAATDADRLGGAAISLLQGSLIRARLQRSPDPILQAGDLLVSLFDGAAGRPRA